MPISALAADQIGQIPGKMLVHLRDLRRYLAKPIVPHAVPGRWSVGLPPDEIRLERVRTPAPDKLVGDYELPVVSELALDPAAVTGQRIDFRLEALIPETRQEMDEK